jgi:hypothetical protein
MYGVLLRSKFRLERSIGIPFSITLSLYAYFFGPTVDQHNNCHEKVNDFREGYVIKVRFAFKSAVNQLCKHYM